MKLHQFIQDMSSGDKPPVAPSDYLIFCPPGGAAIECPSLEAAAAAAARWAARNPGKLMAVYQRIGSAFAPIVEPVFTPSEKEALAELMAPETRNGEDDA